MSLLINESYANPAKPLWVGAGGGTITGNLVVNGGINATGTIGANGDMITSSPDFFRSLDGVSGQPAGTFGSTGNPTTGPAYALLGGFTGIRFTRSGATTGNTELLVTTAGSNNDNLSVGGKVGMLSMGAGADMAGVGTIGVGTTNVTISSTKVTANSLIFLSHRGTPSAGPGAGQPQGNLSYRPSEIVPGVSFKVNLTDSTGVIIAASLVDVPFVWMVIN